jgi:hypothetical protein
MFLDNTLIVKNYGASRGKNSSNLLFLWKSFFICVYFTQMFATRSTAKRRTHLIEFYHYWTSYKVLYRPVFLRQWSIWNSFRKVIKMNLLENKTWKPKAILMTCSHLMRLMKWILRRRRPLLSCWCNSTSLFGDKYRSIQRIKCSSICNYFNWSCSYAT